MNETNPFEAGASAGQTSDAFLEAQLRSAFLSEEADASESDMRPAFVVNDPDRRIKVLTVIEDELRCCTSFDISVRADAHSRLRKAENRKNFGLSFAFYRGVC